jgi:uncharacterized protein
MNKLLLLPLAIALAAPAPLPAAIDCSRAKTNSDKLLCSNSRLQRADQRMALAFREAINRGVKPELLMESQRTWMHDVRDVCNDVECMLRAYEERTSELEDAR